MTPALPQTVGPNPAKAKFFAEAAAAFELLALWHGMTEEEQIEFRAVVVSNAVKQVERRTKEKK